MMFCLRKMMFAPSELRDGSYYRKPVGFVMILLTQMMFERCSNDVLLPQNDVRTRANLGMALIIE